MRIRNRLIRAVDDGWEYAADQRHAEMLIGGLGLKEASGSGAPGEDEKKWERGERCGVKRRRNEAVYRHGGKRELLRE